MQCAISVQRRFEKAAVRRAKTELPTIVDYSATTGAPPSKRAGQSTRRLLHRRYPLRPIDSRRSLALAKVYREDFIKSKVTAGNSRGTPPAFFLRACGVCWVESPILGSARPDAHKKIFETTGMASPIHGESDAGMVDPIVQALRVSLDPRASQIDKRHAIKGLAVFRETNHGMVWAVHKLQSGGDDLEVAFAATVLESAVAHWPRLDVSQRKSMHDTLWLSLPIYWNHSKVVYSRTTIALSYLSCIEWDPATWARIRSWISAENTVEMGLDFLVVLLETTASMSSTSPESYSGKVRADTATRGRAVRRVVGAVRGVVGAGRFR